MCVWPRLGAEDRHRACVCACVRPGGSISGWTGWVGPPLSPGPEVGWGWGVTRRDSLSPLRIREGASEGARGVSGRAHPADLLSGAPLAPRPERLLGLKRAGGTRGGLGEPATRSELAGETSTEGGAGPGPRREEGRPQLHPAPLASFPALLRLLLLFLLYESGISQGFGAATRGRAPGAVAAAAAAATALGAPEPGPPPRRAPASRARTDHGEGGPGRRRWRGQQ